MQTGAVGRCTWKVDVSRVMCRRSCLVFFYNKSLLFYSCFTKVALVPSLYYLICDKLCAVNGWKSSWLYQWNTRGGVGFIDWVQGLSAFTDGLRGRLILCKGKYLSGYVVVCRWSGFCSATSFSYVGWIFPWYLLFSICTCLGFARSLLGCFRVLLDRFFDCSSALSKVGSWTCVKIL